MTTNKIKENNGVLELIIIILIVLTVIFLFFQAVGCLPFSPWVMANNGVKFLCVLK